MTLRQSPSGRELVLDASEIANDSDAPGATVADALDLMIPHASSVIGWNGSGPQILTLQPANHTPGLYSISAAAIIRVAASGGMLGRSYQYSAPNFGPTATIGFSTVGMITPGPPGAAFTSVTCISDGSTPITLTFTPTAVTGSPIVDLYGAAVLQGRL